MICTYCGHNNSQKGPEILVEKRYGIYKNSRIVCLSCNKQFTVDDSLIESTLKTEVNFKKLTFEYTPPIMWSPDKKEWVHYDQG